MHLTARQLNRATLARQLLLNRESIDVVDAVHRIVALQAQEPASPYVALWNRIEDFDPADLDAAFADQAIVKGQLMRITLHAVASIDYPAFHEAMQPSLRAARLYDGRFRSEGVAIADVEALVPDLLAFTATPRSNQDVERWLEQRFGAPKPRVWWAMRQYGPFVHAASGPSWSFGPRPGYVGARIQTRPEDPAASVQWLVRRYLAGFGPATMQDIAQFGTILRPPVKAALEALGDDLVRHVRCVGYHGGRGSAAPANAAVHRTTLKSQVGSKAPPDQREARDGRDAVGRHEGGDVLHDRGQEAQRDEEAAEQREDAQDRADDLHHVLGRQQVAHEQPERREDERGGPGEDPGQTHVAGVICTPSMAPMTYTATTDVSPAASP